MHAVRMYGRRLYFSVLHKWLGVLWDRSLEFEANFTLRTGAARGAFG